MTRCTMSKLTEETFVRDLPTRACKKLGRELDVGKHWERLAEKIPVVADQVFSAADFSPRYKMRHIAILAAKLQHGKSAGEFLLIDWGHQNCRLKHLIMALRQAQLFSLVEYIETELLHMAPQSQQVNNNSESPGLGSSPSASGQDTARDLANLCVANSNEPPIENGEAVPEASGMTDTISEASTKEDRLSHHSGPGRKTSIEGAPPPFTPEEDDVSSANLYPAELNQLRNIDYEILKKITNQFDSRHFTDGGNCIGEGGFGTVFLGVFHVDYKVAIKCLKDNSEDSLDQFKTEVETLCAFKHENLVCLLGYSVCGDSRCLVYQYMPNGSLEDRLACRYGTPVLSVAMRVQILCGTARGIAFLNKGDLTHRDIKSANILLDAEFNPKVGDFATARVAPSGMTTKVMNTKQVIGTSAYLAPEALSFVVHAKLDSFSFGVVLLETLTGLPAVDMSRKEVDIKYHVLEYCVDGGDDSDGEDESDDDDPDEKQDTGTIFDLLDPKAGDWDPSVVDTLYSIACRCLENTHPKRPKVKTILPELEKLTSGWPAVTVVECV